MSKTFGKLLEDIREQHGLSASRLARRVGCDHSYISRLEYGTRTPSFSLVVLLANALGLQGAERIRFFSSAHFSEHPISRIESMLLHDIQMADLDYDKYRVVKAVLTEQRPYQLPLF